MPLNMSVIKLAEGWEPDVDGEINLIYGGIGGGKNTLATKMILQDLAKGMTVFATWKVAYNGFNQMDNLFYIILGILGLKRTYYKTSAGNFHHIGLKDMMSDDFMKKLSGMTDCAFYIDEAYAARIFDSYRKTSLSVEERMAVYITRHVNRKFIIVAQRPNAIHVSSRSMVNRFYKCQQIMPKFLVRFFRFYIFIRTEYQEMIDETVDEETPASVRVVFLGAHSKFFRLFDSKYMREGREALYRPVNEIYRVSWFSRWGLLLSGFKFGRQRSLER